MPQTKKSKSKRRKILLFLLFFYWWSFCYAKVKLYYAQWSCFQVAMQLFARSEVKIAYHFALGRNFTRKVNFTITDKFTCPKGKLSLACSPLRRTCIIPWANPFCILQWCRVRRRQTLPCCLPCQDRSWMSGRRRSKRLFHRHCSSRRTKRRFRRVYKRNGCCQP